MKRLQRQIIRKVRQAKRIYSVYLLCKAYEYFHLRQLHSDVLKNEINYKDAEQLSDFANEVFGAETTPSTFLLNRNQVSDSALEYHEKYKGVLSGLSKISQKCVDSFCKQVHYGDMMYYYKSVGYLHYPMYLGWIDAYINNRITFEDVRNHIIEIDAFNGKAKKVDSFRFRRDFIKIEQLYRNIQEKCYKRYLKAQKQHKQSHK